MPVAARLYPLLLGAVLALSLIRYDRTVLVLLLAFLIHARRELGEAVRTRLGLAAAVALLSGGRFPRRVADRAVEAAGEDRGAGRHPQRRERRAPHASTITVTGPSLIKATPMQAPNTPFFAPRRSQTRS